MGTIRKFFNNPFNNQTDKKTKSVKTVKVEPVKDAERVSWSPRATAKNNRKRTKGRKFYYQQIGNKTIKHMLNEAY